MTRERDATCEVVRTRDGRWTWIPSLNRLEWAPTGSHKPGQIETVPDARNNVEDATFMAVIFESRRIKALIPVTPRERATR